MEFAMYRRVAAGLAFAALLVAVSPVVSSAEDKMRVVLLGTGGPEYFPDRLGISTLVEANSQKLLFDVGRGANQRLYQSRVNPKDITTILLTHLPTTTSRGCPIS